MAALSTAILLVTGACGNDGDSGDAGSPATSNATTTETTDLPGCDEERHVVFFTTHGGLTADPEEFSTWLGDSSHVMEPRSGAVALMNAYHDLGYELVYTTWGNEDIELHGVPYPEAMDGWLESQGFPLGERAWLRTGITESALLEDLVKLSVEGGTAHAAYTNNPVEIAAYITGGIPRDQVYALDGPAVDAGATEMTGGNLAGHVSLVEDLSPVCRPESGGDE